MLTKLKHESIPNMQTLNRSWMVALAALAMPAPSRAEPPLTLSAAASVTIPHSTGAFDFLRVDPKRNRLLAAHERDGTSDFIDLGTHTVIARLKVGGAVDTAVDADSKLYWVSVQEAARVAVVDANARGSCLYQDPGSNRRNHLSRGIIWFTSPTTTARMSGS
jgi:hypothetical protein